MNNDLISRSAKGEWIEHLYGKTLCRYSYFSCNNCGFSMTEKADVCPNCKAKMREEA